MMASAALLRPMTPRRARKFGASGPFRAIPRKASKQKNWRWPRKPGSAKARGKSAEAIYGTAGADVGYGEMTGVKITGEKLFSQCIIAVKADTGEYVWHFQTGTEGVHSE